MVVRPTDLLIATRNAGKARELSAMLGTLFDGTRCLQDVDDDGFEPEETGRTFRDNACLKASVYALHFRCHVLADDSGLSVDALDGAPGVFSARYAEMHEPGSGDEANNALLLRRLAKTADGRRVARFVCVLALAAPDGRVLATAEGDVGGSILREPRGSNGFGYDPLFLVPKLGMTTAELSAEEKGKISHRGVASRRLRDLLDRHGYVLESTS